VHEMKFVSDFELKMNDGKLKFGPSKTTPLEFETTPTANLPVKHNSHGEISIHIQGIP